MVEPAPQATQPAWPVTEKKPGLHEHSPVEDRSDEFGGQALTHCPPAEDEHSALRHCEPAVQAADGEPRQRPVTNDCSALGHVHAFVVELQSDGARHVQELEAAESEVEPPPQTVHGAPPPPPPPKNVASHWQAPVDGAGDEPDGHEDTHAEAAQRPLRHVVPCVQLPPVSVRHVVATVVEVALGGGFCPTGQEHRFDPRSHESAPLQLPQSDVEPPQPLGAAPHCAFAAGHVRGSQKHVGHVGKRPVG